VWQPGGSMPRSGTWAGESGDDFFGTSTITWSPADTSAVEPSCRMPGASLMTVASVPSIPLVISVSEPSRMTSARPGEPAPIIAPANPAEIDSTDTKTTTTPAIPIMATAEEPSLLGTVSRLSSITAIVCLSHFTRFLLIPSESVGDPKAHRPHGRHAPCKQTHTQHQRFPRHHNTRRQRKTPKQ